MRRCAGGRSLGWIIIDGGIVFGGIIGCFIVQC